MNKKYFVLSLALFLGTVVFGQKMDIDWGKTFDSKTEVQQILGFHEDEMITFSTKGKKMYIDVFSSDGYSLESSAEFELPDMDGNSSGMLNLALTGDHVTLILYDYFKKTKSFTLYAQSLDFNGKLTGKKEEVYQSEEVDGKIKDMTVDFTFSPSQNKGLVFFNRSNKERTDYFTDMIVLDLESELSVVSTNKLKYEMRDSKSDKVSFKIFQSVENDGSFNVIYNKIEYYKSKIVDFAMNVERYTDQGELIGSAEINEDNKAFLNPTLLVKDDKIQVVGYYVNNANGRMGIRGYSGLFVAELSMNVELMELHTNSFTDDFLSNLYSERRMKKSKDKDRELLVPAAYTMNDIIIHEDGSMTVLSEYFTVVSTTDRGQTTTVTTYGNVLFFKLDSSGELVTSEVIRKLQQSRTASMGIGVGGGVAIFVSFETKDKLKKYWSYSLSHDNGVVYLVFNDHFKNMNDDEDDVSRAMTNPKKSVPYMVTIFEDGSFEKKAMVESGDMETYIIPQVTYHMSATEFVIWGVWRKDNKFGLGKIS